MLTKLFHAWEHRLATVTTDRVVRPFEWGLDWIPENGHTAPFERLSHWADEVLADSDQFFSPGPTDDYRLRGNRLTFPSAHETPHPENNVVHARYFPADYHRNASAPRMGVVVLPQWNADPGGHVGLCRLLARTGLSALRLSMPYHDERMPATLHRADYILSSNVGRTLQVCRQAVLDARRAVDWLVREGYERIGILGTSLGSCLAMLTSAHDPRIRAVALNHISPYFADVVWEGLSTQHVRKGFEGHIELERLRRLWLPISPLSYVERMRETRILLVYARYDLTFPVALSRFLVDEFRRREIDHELVVLPCGHYSTGIAPFKWLDGWVLTRFLNHALRDTPTTR